MHATPMIWTGRALSALFVLFMLGASIAPKLLGAAIATETMVALGWPDAPTLLIGLIELGCVLLYLLPQTSVLGAVLMTAVLGGAIATQMQAGSPLLSHTLFGIYIGLFMWGGLWLRSPALRAVFPLKRGA